MASSAYKVVLSKQAGLTSDWGYSPPGDFPLWKFAAVLNGNGPQDEEQPGLSSVAGAAGFDRQSTICRGVGEVVERVALFPEVAANDMVQAVSMVDSATLEVDRREVDYPVEGSAAPFDSTPSGAAAGLSEDDATRAALIEQIERDALQVAWFRQDGLRIIEPMTLAALDCHRTVNAAADICGIDLTTARLPVAHSDLVVIAVLAVDRVNGFTSVGMKTSQDTSAAVLGASAEAFQIADAVRILASGDQDSPVPTKITHDEERARWLREPANASLVMNWFASAPEDDKAPVQTSEKITTSALIEAVVGDGGLPIKVDLSSRLPEIVRSNGWHAVKVLVRGYQPLRMDETLDATLVPGRVGQQVTTAPHPLI